MASAHRRKTADMSSVDPATLGCDEKYAALLRDVLASGKTYSFFQVVRLLKLMSGVGLSQDAHQDAERAFFARRVAIRPELSLGFPGVDVTEVETTEPTEPAEDDEDKEDAPAGFRVTTTFLGLYGASSPLPTFYTEDLIDDVIREDTTVTRDFLDIVNRPFYRHFYDIWSKHRWLVKLFDEDDDEAYERLYALAGLSPAPIRDALPGSRLLLRYLGLLSHFPRSAAGLRALLADALEIPDLEIEQCVERSVAIPDDQRLRLGRQAHALGENTVLGVQASDRMNAFRLHVGPLDAHRFHMLLPDMPLHYRLGMLLGVYLHRPLDCELRLVLEKDEIGPARLGGGDWSMLGVDTWLFSTDRMEDHGVASFPVVQS